MIVLNLYSYFELFIVCLFIVIPFIMGIIMQKIYNMFHGIITYFFCSYIIHFLFFELDGTNNIFTDKQSQLISDATDSIYDFVYESVISIPNIKGSVLPNEKFVVLTIVFLIYFLIHITFMSIDRIKY